MSLWSLQEAKKYTDKEVKTVDDRVTLLTAEQQQDGEVIEARKGEVSLKAKMDSIDAQLADKADKTLVDGANRRIDNLVLESGGDSNIEVADARFSVTKNKAFDVLGERIQEIEKDSYFIMKNLIENGNFEIGTARWNIKYGTGVGVNNELVYTVTELHSSARIEHQTATPIIGHKYFIKGFLYPKYGYWNQSYMRFGSSPPFFLENQVPNQWNELKGVITAQTTDPFRFYHRTDVNYAIGDTIKYKDIMCIDLTETFGHGNEPDIDVIGNIVDEWFLIKALPTTEWKPIEDWSIPINKLAPEVSGLNNYSIVPIYENGTLTEVKELDDTVLKKQTIIEYNADGTVNNIIEKIKGYTIVYTLNYDNQAIPSVVKQLLQGGL